VAKESAVGSKKLRANNGTEKNPLAVEQLIEIGGKNTVTTRTIDEAMSAEEQKELVTDAKTSLLKMTKQTVKRSALKKVLLSCSLRHTFPSYP
jgi:hypothetical protein